MQDIKVGDKFRHFKGNIYTVVSVATHTETNETLVVYCDDKGNCWARPRDMFCSPVDLEKYPKAMQKNRFEKI